MEFWGAEVKGGEPFTVLPEDGMVLHLSQACLGEVKNGKTNEPVYLFIHVNGKKLVLGTLFTEKLPQQQFDLVFDQEFQISHNWKSGSVYFYGYMASNGYEEESAGESDSESSEEEEELPVQVQNNGKAKQEKPVEAVKANAAKEKKTDAVKANAAKEKKTDAVKANAGKQKVKIVEPEKDESSDDDLMSDDDDLEDSDDSEDESGESDEETPKKAEPSKKRAAESATKTPVQDKKAKVTPQKTDGKKVSGHVATPHPAKKGADKTPKPNQQTPKSGGSSSHTCKSCSKGFGSEKALESHSKAKHGDGK
ncbi:hypothetical protein ACP275_10G096100 [Erythranthe tilingii]